MEDNTTVLCFLDSQESHHFVREALESNVIDLVHISTNEMAADVLTKALNKTKHFKCMDILGIVNI